MDYTQYHKFVFFCPNCRWGFTPAALTTARYCPRCGFRLGAAAAAILRRVQRRVSRPNRLPHERAKVPSDFQSGRLRRMERPCNNENWKDRAVTIARDNPIAAAAGGGAALAVAGSLAAKAGVVAAVAGTLTAVACVAGALVAAKRDDNHNAADLLKLAGQSAGVAVAGAIISAIGTALATVGILLVFGSAIAGVVKLTSRARPKQLPPATLPLDSIRKCSQIRN
jgi:hypothetical protein